MSEIHERLLAHTIKNALKTPFYQATYSGIDTSGVDHLSLQRLPLVTKTELVRAGRDAQVREGLVCDEIFTSGTTGEHFVTVRGNKEQQFIREFYCQFYESLNIAIWIRGLQINSPYHGAKVEVPAPIHLHRVGIYDRGSFSHARSVLSGEHVDFGVSKKCTVLVGLERMLRAFAHDTLDAYPQGFPCGLSQIVPYAQYLSRRSRSLLRQAFKPRAILDRYGMSEIFGGASEHEETGWYYFDPSLIAEVISPGTHECIKEGIGILVLTSLFPFQEAQPMIRYYTGDIVAVTHCDTGRPGEIAIRPLGREKYSIPRQDGNSWILTPAEVYEVIDECLEVKRSPLFLDASQVRDPYRVGHPMYNVSYTDHGPVRDILIQIEVEAGFEDDSMNLEVGIANAVIAESKTLRDMVFSKEATLCVRVCENFPPHIVSYRE